MNILIIEDEIPAQQQLLRLIRKYYPGSEIAGVLDSISSAASWLEQHAGSAPDIIFMDVELSDGECFELFKRVEIISPVIITTAYSNYALNAFQTKCIDYLMKPYSDEDFKASVDRCIKLYIHPHSEQLLKEIEKFIVPHKQFRQRFTIKSGSQIMIVDIHNIAYFFSENKSTYIVTKDGKQYISDLSIDALESEVDPASFFKLSRGCLAGLESIDSISKYFNSRLKVVLKPNLIGPVLVSRARIQNFMDWLEGRN